MEEQTTAEALGIEETGDDLDGEGLMGKKDSSDEGDRSYIEQD